MSERVMASTPPAWRPEGETGRGERNGMGSGALSLQEHVAESPLCKVPCSWCDGAPERMLQGVSKSSLDHSWFSPKLGLREVGIGRINQDSVVSNSHHSNQFKKKRLCWLSFCGSPAGTARSRVQICQSFLPLGSAALCVCTSFSSRFPAWGPGVGKTSRSVLM